MTWHQLGKNIVKYKIAALSFLAISTLSIIISYYWGEKRILYLLLIGIFFPIVVFIFFETILGLRFPPGIITNIYYN